MKLLYTSLFFLCLPLIIVRLFLRGLRAPAYWCRWPERFGDSRGTPLNSSTIWIHAVSVGEVEACRPLVKALQTVYPRHNLLITTMTPTGSERIKLLFSDTVFHCYLPYDLPFAINRFLKLNKPAFGIIMETEIWPNLIFTCKQKSIPLVLANARMSARSTKGYANFPKFIKSILNNLCFIAAQGQQDHDNFHKLGIDLTHVHKIGNLKYEISLPSNVIEQSKAMRVIWGNNRQVLVAGSTHEGEEEIILQATRLIQSKFPNLLLVLVPRHPERFDRVAGLAHRAGFKTHRHSDNLTFTSDTQVLIVDSMGELPLFYAVCDIAFVGGSLIPHGGHNLLEPAALGRAILTGPHFFNFYGITKQFLQAHAAIEVSDIKTLSDSVSNLLANPKQRAQMGETSLKLIANSRGASLRLIELLKQYIVIHDPE